MHLIASSVYDCEGIQFRMKTQMWLWHSSVKHKEAKPSSIKKKLQAMYNYLFCRTSGALAVGKY